MLKKTIIWVLLISVMVIIAFFTWVISSHQISGELETLKRSSRTGSIYDRYSIDKTRYGDDYYYLIRNVISDANSIKPNKNQYFRVGFAMNVGTEKNIKLLTKHEDFILETIRTNMSGLQVGRISSTDMTNLKQNIKIAINKEFKANIIKEIYLDELVGQ